MDPGGGGSWCVFIDYPVDRFDVVPDFGVDSREVWVCTADSPGDDALKLAIANKRTTRVALWINRTYPNTLVKGQSESLQ